MEVYASMVTLTPEASAKVKDLLAEKQRDDLGLRIFVREGGCRGFSYGMAWDSPEQDDTVFEQDGIRVMVDPVSTVYLDGAQVDFQDALMGGGFTIHNPNAASTCGCGQSFKSTAGGGAPKACNCDH